MRTSRILAAALIVAGIASGVARGATTLPVVWSAGGLDAGTTGAGQAARIASDPAGNVAVVSGPAASRDLAVTSYTATGALRWRASVSPSIGTFVGDWVAAAPNGDVVAVGHNVNSSGNPLASTMARFASDGTFQWRVDFAPPFFPSTARLLVDSAGNEYLASSAVGTGMFVRKYSPSGALLWSQQDATTGGGFAVATSLALGPNGADVIATGTVSGGAVWVTASYNASTGARNWLVSAPEGTAARDVVADATRVYVTGQGVTGGGTPSIKYWLTVVAYDRATGARLWRTDKIAADGTDGAGLRMALAPDGSVVVAGQTNRGFLDWYTVDLATNGAVRWETVRDGGLNTNEVPADVLVLADGTTVVTGVGGPNLPGGFIQGVTAGYSRERNAALGGVRPDGHSLGDRAAERRPLCDRRVRRTGDVLATSKHRRRSPICTREPRCDGAGAELDRPDVGQRIGESDGGPSGALQGRQVHGVRSRRNPSRKRVELHGQWAGSADDVQVPSARTQHGRRFRVLEHGERAHEQVAIRGASAAAGAPRTRVCGI